MNYQFLVLGAGFVDVLLEMKIQKFTELIVWQKSKKLISITYSASNEIKNFSFKDQLNRASLSISNNIAEGFGRRSNREFKRFLKISLGSAYEVNSMLIVFHDISILSDNLYNEALACVEEVIRMLIGLISKIEC